MRSEACLPACLPLPLLTPQAHAPRRPAPLSTRCLEPVPHVNHLRLAGLRGPASQGRRSGRLLLLARHTLASARHLRAGAAAAGSSRQGAIRRSGACSGAVQPAGVQPRPAPLFDARAAGATKRRGRRSLWRRSHSHALRLVLPQLRGLVQGGIHLPAARASSGEQSSSRQGGKAGQGRVLQSCLQRLPLPLCCTRNLGPLTTPWCVRTSPYRWARGSGAQPSPPWEAQKVG